MRPSGTEGLTPCLLLKGVFVQLRIREKTTTTTTTTTKKPILSYPKAGNGREPV